MTTNYCTLTHSINIGAAGSKITAFSVQRHNILSMTGKQKLKNNPADLPDDEEGTMAAKNDDHKCRLSLQNEQNKTGNLCTKSIQKKQATYTCFTITNPMKLKLIYPLSTSQTPPFRFSKRLTRGSQDT